MTKTILFLMLVSELLFSTTKAAVLKGTVINAKTHLPAAFVTINSSQNSQTVMTNEDGSFILHLNLGQTTLKCSHIAYYSYSETIDITNDTTEIEIQLNPSLIVLPSIKVYDRDYDAAQRIILEAIHNKDKILAMLNSYQFDAYTKLFVSYSSKSDSLTPLLLTETELTAYWKYPSKYKEIITARKQSSNVGEGGNTVTIDKVLNFNNNRVNINDYSFVSPTAKDALDYYNYYLLDTLHYDTLPVYLLEVEPKSNTTPLFIGTIQINAQTYEIMGVNFKINEGLDSRFLKSLQLVQEFQLFDNKHWMPVILKYHGVVDIPIPFIPSFSFSYIAALQRYQFENNYSDTVFNKKLEVDKNADNFDSTQWLANRFIPLTQTEEKAYDYIDTAKFKIPLKLKLLAIAPAVYLGFNLLTSNPDLFHFNRVEGTYLGYKKGMSFKKDIISIEGKAGYAFDAKLWQQSYSFNYTLSKKHKLKFYTSYNDNIQTRKTVNSTKDDNATGLSLLFKHDPYDYYREKGFTLGTSITPIQQTFLSVSYNDFNQYTMTNNTNYSLFNKDRTYRKNLSISDGELRSLKVYFKYETTQLKINKGNEVSFSTYPSYTVIRFGSEISNHSFLSSDFEFTTFYGQFYTDRQFFNLGSFSLGIYGTTKLSGSLPPQRYTVMDYGVNILDRSNMFRTLHHTNFSGSELLSIFFKQYFGTKLFKLSRLPLIKKIPYSLSIHGGVFWSELKDNTYNTGDELLAQTNNNPYSEIGFSLGRLPLMTKLSFTWQLSSYDTDKFYLGIRFGL